MKKISYLMLAIVLQLSVLLTPNTINALQAEGPVTHTNQNNTVYDIYATSSTLPTLYAGLNTFTTKNESYMWFHRKGTFNTDYLPDNVNIIAPTEGYTPEVLNQIVDKVVELNRLNPDAMFNFYVDDIRLQFILQTFMANNIPESKFNAILLSDGTLTYARFKILFGNDNTYSVWKQHADNFNDKAARILAGEKNVINVNNDVEMVDSMFYASQLNNYQYWMQFPELIKSGDQLVANEIKDMNVVKKAPYDIYNSLDDQSKLAFVKAVGIDKDKFDEIFNKSDKPNLIISGTALPNEYGSFETVINQIVEEYQDEYDIFFKPHPIWDPNTHSQLIDLKRKEFLEGKGIELLPAQLPMESLLWIYPEVKIGGYSSTLYMSAAQGQTLFFIADSKESLVAPLGDLYDMGYFGEAKFFKITQDQAPEQTPDIDENASSVDLSDILVTSNNVNIPLTVQDATYKAELSNNNNSIKLKLIPDHKDAKIEAFKNNQKLSLTKDDNGYSSGDIALTEGENRITIEVTSSNGENKKTYELVLTRATSINNGGIIAGGGGGTIVTPNTNVLEIFSGGKVVKQLDITSIQKDLEYVDIDLANNTDDLMVSFDSEVLKKLDNNGNDFLNLRLNGVIYQMPINLLDLLEYQSDSDASKENKKISLTVQRVMQNDKELDKVLEGGTSVSDLFKINLAVTDDKGQTHEIDHMKKYLNILLPIDNVTEQEKNTLSAIVLVDDSNDNKNVIINPVKLVNKDGQLFSSVSTLVNGSFMIIKNNNIFNDVESHWAKSEIFEAANRLLVNGKGNGVFAPNDKVTRSEFIAMIVRGFGIPVNEQAVNGRWYDKYVNAAINEGLLEKTQTDSNYLNQDISRAEMVSILMKIYKYIGTNDNLKVDEDSLSQFVDSKDLTDEVKQAFMYSVTNNIIKGIPNGQSGALILAPNGNSTRAEAATLIIRTMKNYSLID